MASNQKVLLTVILHHDQAKNLDEILAYPSYDFVAVAEKFKKEHT
ncbi:MAG: hypothetical protein P8185_23460 [Deltaproteobacteria bacterium]